MQLDILEVNHQKIAIVISDDVVLRTPQDALDLMVEAGYADAACIILHEHNLSSDFFNLRTQVAGEILQKFSNYQVKMAIVGDFQKYPSTSLQAFIRESNRGNLIFFVPDTKTAIKKFEQFYEP